MRADIVQTWLAEKGYEPLTGHQIDLLTRFQKRLLEVNQYMNLTAITQDEDFAVKHIIDSLTLLPWVLKMNGSAGERILDVGAGAGFPGLALNIVQPDINMTLLDSLRKRIFFLRETAEMLGLCNVECIHARAEELARGPAHRGRYTVVTARAVARLDKLMGYTLPFLQKDGLLLAMKGPEAEAETREAMPVIKKYGGVPEGLFPADIGPGIRRVVVVVRKV